MNFVRSLSFVSLSLTLVLVFFPSFPLSFISVMEWSFWNNKRGRRSFLSSSSGLIVALVGVLLGTFSESVLTFRFIGHQSLKKWGVKAVYVRRFGQAAGVHFHQCARMDLVCGSCIVSSSANVVNGVMSCPSFHLSCVSLFSSSVL